MIKFENVVTPSGEQWRSLILGARNAMNSWERSDSGYCLNTLACHSCKWNRKTEVDCKKNIEEHAFVVGKDDLDLMRRLASGGPVHAKYRRMIVVYADITAPLYFWKQFDQYKIGTVTNSCSTMHKLTDKEFRLEDFSCEHLNKNSIRTLEYVIEDLNYWRDIYINGGMDDNYDGTSRIYNAKDKDAWWQMIQLLPSSYNQKRTVMMNYEVLANIYCSRKDHKLDEWHVFCDWIKTLPYSVLIIGEKDEEGK